MSFVEQELAILMKNTPKLDIKQSENIERLELPSLKEEQQEENIIENIIEKPKKKMGRKKLIKRNRLNTKVFDEFIQSVDFKAEFKKHDDPISEIPNQIEMLTSEMIPHQQTNQQLNQAEQKKQHSVNTQTNYSSIINPLLFSVLTPLFYLATAFI